MAPHDYVIGDGDLISIEVFDVKELSRDVRVSQTGTIGIPLVPVRLHVSGLTEVQAQEKIAEVLEADGLVSHPEVSVTVRERKSKPITVVGAVGHPLVYQADRQVSLLEVLAEAGGLANDAGDEVIITRPIQPMSFDDSEPPATGPPEFHTCEVSPDRCRVQATSPAAASSSSNGLNPEPPIGPEQYSQEKSASAAAPAPASSRAVDTITVNLYQLMEAGNLSDNILLQAGGTS